VAGPASVVCSWLGISSCHVSSRLSSAHAPVYCIDSATGLRCPGPACTGRFRVVDAASLALLADGRQHLLSPRLCPAFAEHCVTAAFEERLHAVLLPLSAAVRLQFTGAEDGARYVTEPSLFAALGISNSKTVKAAHRAAEQAGVRLFMTPDGVDREAVQGSRRSTSPRRCWAYDLPAALSLMVWRMQAFLRDDTLAAASATIASWDRDAALADACSALAERLPTVLPRDLRRPLASAALSRVTELLVRHCLLPAAAREAERLSVADKTARVVASLDYDNASHLSAMDPVLQALARALPHTLAAQPSGHMLSDATAADAQRTQALNAAANIIDTFITVASPVYIAPRCVLVFDFLRELSASGGVIDAVAGLVASHYTARVQSRHATHVTATVDNLDLVKLLPPPDKPLHFGVDNLFDVTLSHSRSRVEDNQRRSRHSTGYQSYSTEGQTSSQQQQPLKLAPLDHVQPQQVLPPASPPVLQQFSNAEALTALADVMIHGPRDAVDSSIRTPGPRRRHKTCPDVACRVRHSESATSNHCKYCRWCSAILIWSDTLPLPAPQSAVSAAPPSTLPAMPQLPVPAAPASPAPPPSPPAAGVPDLDVS
jgi:hypothetical protein